MSKQGFLWTPTFRVFKLSRGNWNNSHKTFFLTYRILSSTKIIEKVLSDFHIMAVSFINLCFKNLPLKVATVWSPTFWVFKVPRVNSHKAFFYNLHDISVNQDYRNRTTRLSHNGSLINCLICKKFSSK